MTKFASLKSLITVYGGEKNESFINYKLSLISLVLGGFCLLLWVLFGEFSSFILVVKCLEIALLSHVVVSLLSVINDYVFDVVLKHLFKGLWLLISLRMMVEILIF
jgi:hypothetical protein